MAIRVSVKLTVPDKVLNPQNVIDEIAKTQRNKTAPEVQKLFKHTVEGWQNPPTFAHRQRIRPDEIAVTIYTAFGRNTEQYALVNAGAPPHEIHPINSGGWLRFQRGYRSSTRPRLLYSRAHQRYGPFSAARMVRHPGFEAREFDQEIAEQYQDTFQNDMQQAVNRGAHMP